MKQKILLTLALLLTAVGGAWAVGVGAKIGTTEYATLDQAISSAQDGDIIQLQSDAALTESIIVEKRITIDYNGYIISRVGNTYGGIFWNVDMTFTDSDDTGRGGMKCYYGLYIGSNAKANLCGGRYDDSAETILTGSYNIPTGYEIVNINADGSADADGFISRVVRNYLNDTKTVATMTMPASDVDVDYELVRDMAKSVTATMNASIFRLMEDGQGGYKPVEGMPTPELTVKDELGTEAVTMTEGTTAAPADYTAVLQKLTSEEGAQEEEWTDVSAEDGPTLGTYRYAITGQGDYDGTIYTENFLMSLRIPAEISYAQTFLNKDKGDVFVNTLTNTGDGEVTYKLTGDNIATIDPETGKVTITGRPGVVTVTATVEDSGDYSYETKSVTYVISVGLPLADPPYDYDDKSIGAHKLALLTVINIAKEIDLTNKTDKSANKLRMTIAECEELLTSKTVTHEELDEARIRLLIAIDNLEDKAPADADADIANGQNQENEETTGVRPIDNGQLTIENWYTLNGRKLDKKPTKKGVYILNGKKVVIK